MKRNISFFQFILFFVLQVASYGQTDSSTDVQQTEPQISLSQERFENRNKNDAYEPVIELFNTKQLETSRNFGTNIPDHLESFDKSVYSTGICTQTVTFSHKPIDRYDSYTWANGIRFETGNNTGVGECQIPEGAIIKSCIVTVKNPIITDPSANLNHGQVRINISGTGIGATNRFDLINSGIDINCNQLCGTEVNGFGVDVILSGTNYCASNHNHRMTITVDVILEWEVINVYYQSATSQQNSYLGDCLVHIGSDPTKKHVFADNGTHSTGGFYTNDINNVYRTFCPEDSGKCIRATVSYMDIEQSYDYLYISNGPAQNSPNFWVGSRTLLNPQTLVGSWSNPFISSSENGCITFRFRADNSITYGGFYIYLESEDCNEANSQTHADCSTAIPICADTSFTGASKGPGYESTCEGCLLSESFATWYYFEFTQSGKLAMTLTPITITDDYDFAIFKAADCSEIGEPERCSYAMDQGVTGLGNGSTDTSEGVEGDKWVAQMDVSVGDTYFLLINNWTALADGYNLNFHLIEGAQFRDCDELPILPVELIQFDAHCSNGKTDLYWATASETNNDHFTVLKSYNGFMFIPLGSVQGQGNSNLLHTYSFTDDKAEDRTIYYQLKQTDLNGETSYSKIISVNCSGITQQELHIADHNEEGYFIASFNTNSGKNYFITLTNTGGKTVYKEQMIAGNSFEQYTVNTSNLSPGIYILNIISDTHNYLRKIWIQ